MLLPELLLVHSSSAAACTCLQCSCNLPSSAVLLLFALVGMFALLAPLHICTACTRLFFGSYLPLCAVVLLLATVCSSAAACIHPVFRVSNV